MTEKVPRLLLCREPYCPIFVERSGYCPDHRAGKSRSGSSGYGARWAKVRNAHLSMHPVCEDCGSSGPWLDVHHGDHAGPGDRTFLSSAALRTLCRSCHRKTTEAAKKEARDRAGH